MPEIPDFAFFLLLLFLTKTSREKLFLFQKSYFQTFTGKLDIQRFSRPSQGMELKTIDLSLDLHVQHIETHLFYIFSTIIFHNGRANVPPDPQWVY